MNVRGRGCIHGRREGVGFAATRQEGDKAVDDGGGRVRFVPDARGRERAVLVVRAEAPDAGSVARMGPLRPFAAPELDAAELGVRVAGAEVEVGVVRREHVLAAVDLDGDPLVVAVVVLRRTAGGAAGVEARAARAELGEERIERARTDVADGFERGVGGLELFSRRFGGRLRRRRGERGGGEKGENGASGVHGKRG
ncbi:MAG: hypothetical protein II839_05275 [Kiritimatiellae bacterium]|nr:hypothetical protein [Kiritimatiellia bacterium]